MIDRLSQNKDVLVKVIKRMNQNFLAATNNENEINIWNLKDDIIYHSDHRRYGNNEHMRIFDMIKFYTGIIIPL